MQGKQTDRRPWSLVVLMVVLMAAGWALDGPARAQEGQLPPETVDAVSLTAQRADICAGARLMPPHCTMLTATVTDSAGNPLPNRTVAFSVTAPYVTAPATVMPSSATTDMNGQATATLTSSDKVGIANVTATCEGVSASVNVTMGAPSGTVTVDPEYVFTGGEQAALTAVWTYAGTPVLQHEIHWRIVRIWDGQGNLVYDADAGTGNDDGSYGIVPELGNVPTTDRTGTNSNIYTSGSEGGVVGIEAQDYSVTTPQHPKASTNEGPTKVVVTRLWLTGDERIHGKDGVLLERHFDSQGRYYTVRSGEPAADAKEHTFDINMQISKWPSAHNPPDPTWRFTWGIQTTDGQTTKAEGHKEGSGWTGAVDVTTPNVVGHYRLKRQVNVYMQGQWKDNVVDMGDMFQTYQRPYLCDASDFTVDHLSTACDWAQGSNDLTEAGSYSTPHHVQLSFSAGFRTGDPQYRSAHAAWDVLTHGGDCLSRAWLMAAILNVLGLPASTDQVGEYDAAHGGWHYFYEPGWLGPWNFEGVCYVPGNDRYYDVAEPSRPHGTHAYMWSNPHGPIIYEWTSDWGP